MRTQISSTSPLWQGLLALSRLAGVLVLLVWLTIALATAVFHGFIVPRLSDWRPDIEAWASAALRTPVRLAALSAQVRDGVPTVELEGLEIEDAQGQVGLRLERARAELSARSLLNLGFDNFRAEGLQVEVQRQTSGQWSVAGIALADAGSAATPDWLNWVFRQGQWRVLDGSVRLRDAWRAQQQGLVVVPEIRWSGVQAVLNNSGRRHLFRIDGQPSVAEGQTWTLRADLLSPRLSRASGDWNQWSGTAYWHLGGVDLAVLSQHLGSRALWGVSAQSGRGDWRAWIDVSKGQAVGVTNDWAMRDVQVRLGTKLQPLALTTLQGRLAWQQTEQALRLETQNLAFRTADGLNWPGGNVQWRWQAPTAGEPEQNHFTAVDLDLATLSQVATRLPLNQKAHQWLKNLSPRGRVDTLQANWSGPWSEPHGLAVQGKVRGLGLSAGSLPRKAALGELARPGVRGLDVVFSATDRGGNARLSMAKGAWDLPGVWAQAVLPLDAMRAQINWAQAGGMWQVTAKDIYLANADVAASGRVGWTQDAGPGVLDLELTAERANLARLGRYLPLVVDADARRYVQAAVRAGQARQVKTRIRGAIADMPFAQPSQGEFSITGEVSGVRLDVAPQSITGGRWPELRELRGRYAFDRTRMVLSDVQAQWAQWPQLSVVNGEATIDGLLTQPQLRTQFEASGPLQDWLRGVQSTRLQSLLNGVLDGVQGQGEGRLALTLSLPLHGKVDPTVQGQFGFAKAAVQWAPGLPRVTQAQGGVQFGARGVTAQVASAQALGGPVSIDVNVDAQGDWTAKLSGEATAEGLRQRPELAVARGLLRSVQGRTPYRLLLAQRGDADLDWTVESSLQGLTIQAPQPLNKPAHAVWALRLNHQAERQQTTLSLAPAGGPQINAQWRHGVPGVATQGVLAVGMGLGEVPPQAGQVVAGVKLDRLDIDAWRTWWSQAQTAAAQPPATAVAPSPTVLVSPAVNPPAAPTVRTVTSPASAVDWRSWLPQRAGVQLNTLQAWGWSFHNLSAQAQRQTKGAAEVWRTDVTADELQGLIEMRPASDQGDEGRVYARLQRLSLASNADSQVENTLFEQLKAMPALDIQVQALNLAGRDWGQVDLLASNIVKNQSGRTGHQWQLERLNVTLPEAKLRAQGQWALEDAGLAQAAQGQWRRTDLNMTLDVSDSGALLARFGMPGVVKGGAGKLSGQLGWRGPPFSLDKTSLSGRLNLDIGRGQFLKADPGIAKLLGVLSLQSLPRRLLLDFRDVFQEGFGFDSIRGNAMVDKGVLRSRDLAMRGPNASVLMEGSADAKAETQDLQVVVLPELDAGTLSVWAGLTNPVLGLASYMVQKIFGSALANANSRAFHVTGSWQDPKVDPILPEAQARVPAPVRAPLEPTPGRASP